MSIWEMSQAEFEAEISRLPISARTFSIGHLRRHPVLRNKRRPPSPSAMAAGIVAASPRASITSADVLASTMGCAASNACYITAGGGRLISAPAPGRRSSPTLWCRGRPIDRSIRSSSVVASGSAIASGMEASLCPTRENNRLSFRPPHSRTVELSPAICGSAGARMADLNRSRSTFARR